MLRALWSPVFIKRIGVINRIEQVFKIVKRNGMYSEFLDCPKTFGNKDNTKTQKRMGQILIKIGFWVVMIG